MQRDAGEPVHVRVVVIDADDRVRESLCGLLCIGDRLEVVGSTGEVGPAVDGLTRVVDLWRAGIAEMSDDDIFTVGFSQATEIDQRAPFAHLVAHVNREIIHHGSEISTLTDLYRVRGGTHVR